MVQMMMGKLLGAADIDSGRHGRPTVRQSVSPSRKILATSLPTS